MGPHWGPIQKLGSQHMISVILSIPLCYNDRIIRM